MAVHPGIHANRFSLLPYGVLATHKTDDRGINIPSCIGRNGRRTSNVDRPANQESASHPLAATTQFPDARFIMHGTGSCMLGVFLYA